MSVDEPSLHPEWDTIADLSLHPRTIAALDFAAPNAAFDRLVRTAPILSPHTHLCAAYISADRGATIADGDVSLFAICIVREGEHPCCVTFSQVSRPPSL